jgi:hypothetical protein
VGAFDGETFHQSRQNEQLFGEKAIMVAVRTPEGDFRDWAEIKSWTHEIADSLVKEVSET